MTAVLFLFFSPAWVTGRMMKPSANTRNMGGKKSLRDVGKD